MTAMPMHTLDAADSWTRLRSKSVGRLAVSVGDQPDVFPVNFLALENTILIRTGAGGKLDDITSNALVAFEIDDIGDHLAWSVVVKGTAKRVDDLAAIETAQHSPLWTWIPRDADVFVSITPVEISGRSFHRD